MVHTVHTIQYMLWSRYCTHCTSCTCWTYWTYCTMYIPYIHTVPRSPQWTWTLSRPWPQLCLGGFTRHSSAGYGSKQALHLSLCVYTNDRSSTLCLKVYRTRAGTTEFHLHLFERRLPDAFLKDFFGEGHKVCACIDGQRRPSSERIISLTW